MQWFYYERDRQAQNRMEMALDHDFYDGLQWDPEDAAELAGRRQMPLVYNEVAPMCDWVIGTERRARVDWRVMPRAEDDVKAADLKTKVLKYVADVNQAGFARSRAFADCVKGGIGWVDDGVRDDPTAEPIYSKYEDWRNVLMDSSGLDMTGDDARYVFRWRWVDEDVALLMFPDRADKIRAGVEDIQPHDDPFDNEFDWQSPLDSDSRSSGGSLYTTSSGPVGVEAQRRRVRLIECQYRKPMRVQMVASGPMRGALFDRKDAMLIEALHSGGGSIVDKVTMRVHVAVMTESALLSLRPSAYRHNRFTLTPYIAYRRGRDRMPYGVIRRVRDVQQDLNKRASKAQFLLNTNQLIADQNAFRDPEHAREQAQDPQGVILKKPGSEVMLRRDTDAATGQIQLMSLAAQQIQKGTGVTDENLGRKTNAVSGEAIKARQMQGSVSTTELFDNARNATQAAGQKQLAMVEQFYSEEKVIRLTGQRGSIEWVKINRPEVQPDGSIRFLDDITSSMADFVVSEQDYAGTLRQVMFDSLQQIAQRVPPEMALRLLRMAYEYSDLPNKDEIVDEIRKMTGEPDPDAELSPEEQAQMQAQAQAQAEAMEIQRAQAHAALEEQQAKAREVNARAEKLLAEIEQIRGGGAAGDLEMQDRVAQAVTQVREQAAAQIEKLTAQLADVTASNETDILRINKEADAAAEIARIQADAQVRVFELLGANEATMGMLAERLNSLAKMPSEIKGAKPARRAAAPADGKASEAAGGVHIHVAQAAPSPAPSPGGSVGGKVEIVRDKHGRVTGGLLHQPGSAAKSVDLIRDEQGRVTGGRVQEVGAKKEIELIRDEQGRVTGGKIV
jgi:hypothetical protein